LGAADLAALASNGVCFPLVTRRARVIHFATGDELIAPDQTPNGAQVRDCNSILISSLLAERGVRLVVQERLRDSLDAPRAALDDPDFDVALISGGASVGDHDFARPMLKAAGFAIHLEKVNLRPGKPLVFATRGRQLAFGLPGNPVSHWVIFQLFLTPLFEKLSGRVPGNAWRRGRFREDFAASPNARETYWPASAECEEGEYRLRPLRFVSSSDIAGLAGANALVKIAPGRERIAGTETADFLLCEP
jgi:molybdopterin molybdotransferase